MFAASSGSAVSQPQLGIRIKAMRALRCNSVSSALGTNADEFAAVGLSSPAFFCRLAASFHIVSASLCEARSKPKGGL
jgi:hypothetical protein